MRLIYEPGYDLAKAGVMLMDLCDAGTLQGELDLDDDAGRDRGPLMAVMDKLNGRWGKATIQPGGVGIATMRRDWAMRQARRTPHYTTDWHQVPIARA